MVMKISKSSCNTGALFKFMDEEQHILTYKYNIQHILTYKYNDKSLYIYVKD